MPLGVPWNNVVEILYFMLPAFFANMAPVIFRHSFPKLAVPIDFGRKLRRQPIFGNNKTWRGFIVGVCAAIVVSSVQANLYQIEIYRVISLYDYENWLLFGFLMGFGALFGDLVKSFFKRRLRIPPGKWLPGVDQVDFIVGSLLFATPIIDFGWAFIGLTAAVSLVPIVIANQIAFYLKMRKVRF